MAQAIQIAGAVAILAGLVFAQLQVVDVRSWSYLWLNAVGAGVLSVAAWHERQWDSCCSKACGRSSRSAGWSRKRARAVTDRA